MGEDIKLLYHSNYWDGPLSGACLYQDKKFWFNCVHDYWDDYEGKPIDLRIYAIYDLAPEEWENEGYWHALFEEHVGTHTSYDQEGRRSGEVHKDRDHSIFYNMQKEAGDNYKKKNLKEPLGYFDRAEMKFRKIKFRNYFIEGESPYSIHNMKEPRCSMREFIEWRNDAKKFHEEFGEHDFDGKSSGWAICVADSLERKPYWLTVEYCPWCNAKLPQTWF